MPSPPTVPPADRLRLWRRFHIRLSAMYAGLVLAVLLSMSGYFYVRGVDRERAALQARLRIAAAALASSIEPADLAELRTPDDVERPAYQRLATRFRAVAAAEPDFSDLYVMRRGAAPGSLEIVVDVVLVGDAAPGLPGEPYQPARATRMLEGFERPTVEDTPYTDAWGTVLSGYAPIRDGHGGSVALVGIDVRAARLAAIKRETALLALGVLAVAVGLLALLAAIVARMVREPLARIVDATNAIAAGQLSVRAQLDRRDEFGVVGRHFDHMAQGLEEREFIKDTFGQYVSPEVVSRMIADRSQAVLGQRRHVAVMFSDVRGFTTLSEGLPPEEVVVLLNQYLERMTLVINQHGGRIDKFIGDAIMADWGSLEDSDHPEASAVAAALAMLDALGRFNAERQRAGALPLAIGIALHAGDVVAGSIGSVRKLEYTVIGDAVNVTSRLEGLCKVFGARLVASGSLVDAAGQRDRARWLDSLVLRGRAEPTDVYELLTDDDPRLPGVAAYTAAIELLLAGDRDGARAALTALAAAPGADPDPVVDYQLRRLAAGDGSGDADR